MFGYVCADLSELTEAQASRYNAVYCGICRRIRAQASRFARLTLSYDMVFLALLLMSLYEPEESGGDRACMLHPIRKRAWTDSAFIAYAADMNVALAYYQALDDWRDDHSLRARFIAFMLRRSLRRIRKRCPRQCDAIAQCIERLDALERENCANPDACAACFGALMAELFAVREDIWAHTLRAMGDALGRFVYLADAAADYRADAGKKRYNPFLAMGGEPDDARLEEYLVLTMGRCARYYEALPLVQDKPLLDNIVYSGVWLALRRRQKQEDSDGRSV